MPMVNRSISSRAKFSLGSADLVRGGVEPDEHGRVGGHGLGEGVEPARPLGPEELVLAVHVGREADLGDGGRESARAEGRSASPGSGLVVATIRANHQESGPRTPLEGELDRAGGGGVPTAAGLDQGRLVGDGGAEGGRAEWRRLRGRAGRGRRSAGRRRRRSRSGGAASAVCAEPGPAKKVQRFELGPHRRALPRWVRPIASDCRSGHRPSDPVLKPSPSTQAERCEDSVTGG